METNVGVVPTTSTSSASPKTDCAICGNVATGTTFGFDSCNPCKKFFQRHRFDRISEIRCELGGRYTCDLSKRRPCTKCRLLRCLRLSKQTSKEFLRDADRNHRQVEQHRGVMNKLRSFITERGTSGDAPSPQDGDNPGGSADINDNGFISSLNINRRSPTSPNSASRSEMIEPMGFSSSSSSTSSDDSRFNGPVDIEVDEPPALISATPTRTHSSSEVSVLVPTQIRRPVASRVPYFENNNNSNNNNNNQVINLSATPPRLQLPLHRDQGVEHHHHHHHPDVMTTSSVTSSGNAAATAFSAVSAGMVNYTNNCTNTASTSATTPAAVSTAESPLSLILARSSPSETYNNNNNNNNIVDNITNNNSNATATASTSAASTYLNPLLSNRTDTLREFVTRSADSISHSYSAFCKSFSDVVQQFSENERLDLIQNGFYLKPFCSPSLCDLAMAFQLYFAVLLFPESNVSRDLIIMTQRQNATFAELAFLPSLQLCQTGADEHPMSPGFFWPSSSTNSSTSSTSSSSVSTPPSLNLADVVTLLNSNSSSEKLTAFSSLFCSSPIK